MGGIWGWVGGVGGLLPLLPSIGNAGVGTRAGPLPLAPISGVVAGLGCGGVSGIRGGVGGYCWGREDAVPLDKRLVGIWVGYVPLLRGWTPGFFCRVVLLLGLAAELKLPEDFLLLVLLLLVLLLLLLLLLLLPELLPLLAGLLLTLSRNF